MVRPGEMLRLEVTLDKALDEGVFACRGTGIRHRAATGETETAVSGQFTMRPVRGMQRNGADPRSFAGC